MVQILDNGDIVQDNDNDPSTSRRPNSYSSAGGAPSRGVHDRIGHHASDLFTSINGRLADFGVPTYTFYGVTVKPIHFLLAFLSVIFFGLRSLLLIALLLFITNTSFTGGQSSAGNRNSPLRNNGSADSPNRQSRNGESKVFAGRGYTLGK